MKPLSLRKQKFVDAFLREPNATKAAEAAGWAPKTAASAGSRALKDPEVQAALAARAAKVSESAGIDAALVLRELRGILTSDLANAFDVNGRLLKFHDIPEDTRRAISAIKVKSYTEPGDEATEVWTTEIKLWSKDSAIEKAMKHLGLLADHLRVSGKDGQPLEFIVKGPE